MLGSAFGVPHAPQNRAVTSSCSRQFWQRIFIRPRSYTGRVPSRPWLAARRVIAASAEAIERVHAARFVHRDVKPDNLIGGALIDLGLARRLPDDPDDPTRARVQVGSLEYIAPEQLADASRADERADLYALGCVI